VSPIALVAAAIAAAIHVFFFVLESLRFKEPATWRRFNVESQRDADLLGPMAFNQGFYNLFLALGLLAGLLGVVPEAEAANRGVVVFTCAAMVGAGVVLFATNRRFFVAAAIQAGPPLVALIAMFLRLIGR
jgi:putative membrane protein